MPTPAYTTTDLADGVRYHLPPFKRHPVAILLPLAIGIVLICVAVFGPMGSFRSWGFSSVSQTISTVIGVLFGLPFLGMGLLLACVGLFAAVGHAEVELRGQRLRGVGRVGPFRVGRWIPIDQIKTLAVKRPIAKGEGDPSLHKPRLVAVRTAKGDASLAFADGDLLKQIAEDLARRCGLAAPETVVEAEEPEVIDDDESLEPDSSVDIGDGVIIERSTGVPAGSPTVVIEIPPQPTNSKAVLTRNADGITIDFPPRGFSGQARGLLVFGLIWTAGVSLFIFFIVFAKASSTGGGPPIPVYLFLSVFLLIGFGLILGAFSAARRRAIFDVVNGALLVTSKGLRSLKSSQWDAGAVKDIRLGPSGTTVNDKPILELQVIPRSGDKAGFLAWRDDEELRWAAAELRAAAGIGKRPSRSTGGTPPQPGESASA